MVLRLKGTRITTYKFSHMLTASYGVHMDGSKSYTSLETGPINVKSGEQKCITKSN